MIKMFCIVLAFSFVIIQVINGCTAVGLGTGLILDSRAEPVRLNPLLDLDYIEKGKQITVILRSGEAYSGKYDGMGVVDQNEYRVNYAVILQNVKTEIQLPAIGDTVIIYLKPVKDKINMKRVFCGFSFKSTTNGRRAYLKYKYTRSNAFEEIDIRRIHSIVKLGKYEIFSGKVESFIVSGGLSNVTSISIYEKGKLRKISVKDIDVITLKPEKKMTKILSAAGFVCDLIIFMIIKAPNEEGGGGGGGGG
ncbi:hypothetical protein K9N50_06445 [bacterium]|nr:hypothetical protein [bacterium]